jgi:pilus assembly protein Flp/PilA
MIGGHFGRPCSPTRREAKEMLFAPKERGQGLVEYALILVLVAVVVIVILALLGPAIGNVFSNIVSNIYGRVRRRTLHRLDSDADPIGALSTIGLLASSAQEPRADDPGRHNLTIDFKTV